MTSSSGASSTATTTPLQEVMDQRKKKRMLSNRESARRSRQRKQRHLDELNEQVSQLQKENGQIVNALKVTTQHYLGVEAENSVLTTQMMELSSRLQSLNEILMSCCCLMNEACDEEVVMRPWSLPSLVLPMASSVDMHQYC